MKRFLLLPVLVLVLLATLVSTEVLEKRSWAGSEKRLSSSDKQISDYLPSIFHLLLTSSEQLTAIAGASPTSGTVPQAVQFITDSSGPVETWRWDFDGDGSWDWEGTEKENQSYTFFSPHSYTAILQVADKYGNTDTDQVAILLNTTQKPVIAFTSVANKLIMGQATSLEWTVSGANSISIDQSIGSVDATGSLSVAPDSITSYELTATGPMGTTTAACEIQVIDPAGENLEVHIISPAEGETISAELVTVTGIVSQNQGTTEIWVNGESAAVTGYDFSVNVDLEPGLNNIAATASWNGKTANDSISVTRSFTYTPQPKNSFGEQFENHMPADAALASYDKDHFSLITGTIEDEQATLIEDVAVTILNHPEYGTAHTDSTGTFYLPVEGGSILTVVYAHANYLTAHRNLDIPANDIAVVDLVTLVAQDTEVSTVTFDGNPETFVTHQSSVTSDSFGDRTVTTVFHGNNRAWEVDEHGQRIRELSTIETRSTEFSTPASMPSILPPHTAFTYCAELSVEGVEHIEFEQPVVTWVNNFLGFDVGEIVPVGFYNRESAAWVPSRNGVVVRLLDTDSDNITDSFDATGNGSADGVAKGLTDAAAYPPGATFWRVEVSHFTPWDLNWGSVPPDDYVTPNSEEPPFVDQAENDPQKSKYEEDIACSIEPVSRILRENISIQGTGMKLHYASNRVPGYTIPISVPVRGSTVPDSLKNIRVELRIAGQVKKRTLQVADDPMAEFVWNGLYSNGEVATGQVTAHISVGFVYDAVYGEPDASMNEAFSQPGIEPTEVPSREEFIVWKHWKIRVTTMKPSSSENGFGTGWTLSSQHEMRKTAKTSTLYKGDGTVLENIANPVINTFAGGGNIDVDYDNPPPGTLAPEVVFSYIYGVVRDSIGNTYLATSNGSNGAIFKVTPDGFISTYAGHGSVHNNADGIPAIATRIGEPLVLAIDAEDNVYFYDSHWGSRSIRMVDSNGILTTVMGNSNGENCLNNCTKEDDTLSDVRGMTIDQDGNIYITNKVGTIGEPYQTIGKIDTNGIYNAIAGVCSGNSCLSGEDADGEKAKAVALRPAGGLTIAPDGSIYFTSLYDVIRKIDSNGILSTIGGTWAGPAMASMGDTVTSAKALAADAPLYRPTGITLDAAGNIFFTQNGQIQKIDTNANISNIAGQGWPRGYSGDGGPALLAEIDPIKGSSPFNQLTISEGTLYFTDNKRFRMLEILPPVVKDSEGTVVFIDQNRLGHIISTEGRHEKTIDLRTGLALRTFSYHGERLSSISDQFGNETTFQYDTTGMLGSITSPYGQVTHLTFDGDRHLTKVISPDTTHHDFTYSQDGLLLAKQEPNGNIYTHQFDAVGRLTSVADEEGGTWTLVKNEPEDGIVTSSMTTAEGNQKVYAEDISSPGESIMTITSPSGDSSSVSWSDYGLFKDNDLSAGMDHQISYNRDPLYKNTIVEEIDSLTPAGLRRLIVGAHTYDDTDDDDTIDLFTDTYNVNGKTITATQNTLTSQYITTTPVGRATTLTYDPLTLLPLRYQVSRLDDILYEYNSQGRATKVQQGNRSVVSSYNQTGYLSSLTSSEGKTVHFDYNVGGKITNIHNSAGTVEIAMKYDANRSLTELTTAAGSKHTFSYTKTGKIAAYTLPAAGGNYVYDYNSERMPVTVTFPSGKQSKFTYSNSLLVSSQLESDTIINVSYFPGNQINTLTRGDEGISCTYDGQLLLTATPTGVLTQPLVITYNNDYLPATVQYAGATQTLSYDDDGLLIASNTMNITRNSDNALPVNASDGTFTMAFTMNDFGERIGEDSTIDDEDVFSWSVAHDRDGMITEKTEIIEGTSHSFEYTYDPFGRLTNVDRDSVEVESYQYDVAGNRLADVTGQAYTYDSQDKLTAIGATTYNFDVDGFLASKISGTETTTYNYSAWGELQSVILPDATLISYTYDPKGRRIAKSKDGTIVEKYLWGGRNKLLAIYDNSNVLLTRYEYSNSRQPYSMTIGSEQYYLLYDQVGSLKIVSDDEGNIVRQVAYDSFGKITSDTNPALRAEFGFAGGLLDPDTGLLYFSFRDYNPETGRWNAKDPLFFSGGDTNLYTYVSNDPINFVDPYGLSGSGNDLNYGYGDALKDSVVEAAGVLGDTLMLGGGIVAVATAGTTAALAVGTVFLAKGAFDLAMKATNIIDKVNGREASTSGDAATEFVKYVDPDNKNLHDSVNAGSALLNMANPTNILSGSTSVAAKALDKSNDAGSIIGNVNTIGTYYWDKVFGE